MRASSASAQAYLSVRTGGMDAVESNALRTSAMTTPCVLTVAGSDSGGGAGIQADLKAFCARNVYGASVLTALTAQNTTGVQAIHVPPSSFVRQQLDSVLSDIPCSTMKLGMLPTAETVKVVADAIVRHDVKVVVCDPVLVATSGDQLVDPTGVVDAMTRVLFPLTTVLTPNVPEAERILGCTIRSSEDMREACAALQRKGPKAVLLKGGHLNEYQTSATETRPTHATDVLFDGNEFEAFSMPWVDSSSTHGTGCTLAAAIAAELAKGRSLRESSRLAKAYVHRAMQTATPIGNGHGPLNHMCDLHNAG